MAGWRLAGHPESNLLAKARIGFLTNARELMRTFTRDSSRLGRVSQSGLGGAHQQTSRRGPKKEKKRNPTLALAQFKRMRGGRYR